jgi:ribonuclease VapC
MVLDTSAIIAVLLSEPERDDFVRIISSGSPLAISVVTLQEAAIVIAGKKQKAEAAQLVDDLVQDLNVEVVPLDVASALGAREAYFRFGRGYHPAALNFADCFAYALAKMRAEPLLFKGKDFPMIDIVPAWQPG